jgi:ATP-dependent DNA helicase DinG
MAQPAIILQFPGTPPDSIALSYEALAAAMPEFIIREAQLAVSRGVRDTCISGIPLVAEAPTGTGKTLAYLIGALTAARETGLPVVISTATALQQQILSYDLPKLRATGLVANNELALMKGRGRYFCQRNAEKVVQAQTQVQGDLFGEGLVIDAALPTLAKTMLSELSAGRWRGDIDSWRGGGLENKTGGWEGLQADGDTCTGKSCEFYGNCRYFKDRARAATARLVVTNHDLVLADLKLRNDGDSPLLPFDRYAVIFDEAHQLPEKARESASACVSQQDSALLQEMLPVILTGVDARPWLLACLSSEGISSSQLLPGPLQAPMANLFATCAALGVDSDDCVVFGRTAPDALIDVTAQAAESVYPLLAALLVLSTYLRKQLSKENSDLTPAAKAGLLHLATLTSKAVSAARRLLKGLFGFCSSEPHARWLSNDLASGAGFLLHSGPVDGGEVLPDLLWNQPFPVVLISATLQTLGSFDTFTKQAAVPDDAVYLKV